MTIDSCLQRPKTASATVYLMEELGDARMRCDQLVKYVTEASKLIEGSSHRDHLFEVAGHLIQAIPQTLFLLQKALQATALAATRLDYEEIKQELRPSKVDELERALKDVRIRQVQRRSEPWTPVQAVEAIRALVARTEASGHVPRAELMGLILSLEYGLKTADAKTAAEALEAVAASLEDSNESPSQLHLAALLRQVLADDLLKTPQEQATMDKTAMDWKTGNAKTADALDPEAPPMFGLEMVTSGLEKAVSSAKQAQIAMQSGNPKKMFFRLLGVLDGLGMIGRAYDLPDIGYVMRVWKVFAKMAGARPGVNFSASEEPKESKFEEGKPADPTENMSPEDAKKWKEEHDKHKDNFKAALAMSEDVQLEFQTAALALRNAGRGQAPKKNAIIAVRSLGVALGKMGEDRAHEVLWRAADVMQTSGMWDLTQKKLGDDDSKESKFEEGKPADPTENMSPENAKKWKTEHDKHKDNFKAAGAEEAKRSRFEEGKPADPTQNMSPEDAKRWKEEHDKHKDNFKSADDALAWK